MNVEPQSLHSANSNCVVRDGQRERCTLAPPKALPALAVPWVWLTPATADAYIGPGAGLSALGSLLALLGAVLLIIVGFVWYPVKRVMRRWKAARADQDDTEAESPAKE